MEINSQHINYSLAGLISTSPIWFGKNNGILSVNTQARRLGCILYLLCSVRNGKKVESLLFSPKANEIEDLKSNLIRHGYTSGYLTLSKSSFKHYVDVSIELGLLTKYGAVYRLTPKGEFIAKNCPENHLAPYQIDKSMKIALLDSILHYDYYGVFSIINLVRKGHYSLKDLCNAYKENLEEILHNIINESKNSKIKRMAQDRLLTLSKWKKPKKYSEHLVSAKLNWLIDLDIISHDSMRLSKIKIRQHHNLWIKKYNSTIIPSEADIASFLLCYYYAIVNEENEKKLMPKVDKLTICTMTNNIFKDILSVSKSNIPKVRSNQFLISLVCHYPDLILSLADSRIRLFEQGKINCNKWKYRLHTAARHTQSFITRHKI